MQWIANPQNREFESHPVLQFFKNSMLGSSIGQDTRFSSWEEGFDSPTELHIKIHSMSVFLYGVIIFQRRNDMKRSGKR
jgi:hypothetical protein